MSVEKKVEEYLHPVNVEFHTAASLPNRITDAIAAFGGSWKFVAFNLLWWAVWFTLKPFEGPPWGNLTMMLSLEAILLATFVLMNQNRQGAKDRKLIEHTAEESQKAEENTQELLRAIKENTELTNQILQHLTKDVETMKGGK